MESNQSTSPMPPPDSRRPMRSVNSDPQRPPRLTTPPMAPSITVGDIYYILFRHKWKIIICTALGFIAAYTFNKLSPVVFSSEAKLFIKYVTESQGISQEGDEIIRTRTPGARGDTTISSELGILTSADLSEQVARVIGPEKILAASGGGDSITKAAGLIRKDLVAKATGSILTVSVGHPDPQMAQPILRELIDHYLKRHGEIHRGSGMGDGFLAQETDRLRGRLTRTEDELRKARNKAGIISMASAKQSYSDQLNRIQQDIFAASAQLAERTSLLAETPKPPETAGADPAPVGPEASAEDKRQYLSLVMRLQTQQKWEQQLLTFLREDSSRVQEFRTQMAETEKAKAGLEAKFPNIVLSISPAVRQQGVASTGGGQELENARQIISLRARIKELNAQLATVQAEVANVDQMEGAILQLERQKELEETNYRTYAKSLEQARINEALGAGGVSNISQIQAPSAPYSDRTQIKQIAMGMAAGGLVLGLAWAFLIEMLLDHSVRRPIDIERLLRVPLFLSIPRISQKKLKSRPAQKPAALPASVNSDGTVAKASEADTQLAPWDSEHALHPFHETLRDRLISYFESVNLTHKPKLVAVTGLGHKTGVTTTAAGLAASLSRTGDGNVLLVDMTAGQGSAQQFNQGKVVCGLEEVLSARDNAHVESNLYVVGAEPGGERLSRILPNRFNKLLPQLKASNFDYIIFDMPAVSQISITPRLASYMDMVLLVVESEKADKAIVQRATSLLSQSKAHVGVVLNKTKSYVPSILNQGDKFMLGE